MNIKYIVDAVDIYCKKYIIMHIIYIYMCMCILHHSWNVTVSCGWETQFIAPTGSTSDSIWNIDTPSSEPLPRHLRVKDTSSWIVYHSLSFTQLVCQLSLL